ncbi:hypothetical protein P5V15_012722 [Pogonomyrmex californicus]
MAKTKRKKDLLDAEINKIYSLYLNTEDAHKVGNDINFASALLKYAKENISDSGTYDNLLCYIWNKKETLLLISLYKEYEELFTSGKMKQYLCWERVAKAMAKKDYNISAKKCTKFQILKRTYKQIKDHNINPGTRKTWEYFNAMDELYGTKSWIEPISTASSDPNDQPVKLLIQETSCKEKRDAQHKEKMDLLKDIKNLIQETLRKE